MKKQISKGILKTLRREINKEEIESVAKAFKPFGKCNLLHEVLFGNTCEPYDKFHTSYKVNDIKDKADDSQNNSITNTTFFEKFKESISLLPQSAYKNDFQEK